MISTIADNSFLVPTGSANFPRVQQQNSDATSAVQGNSANDLQGNAIAAGGNNSPASGVKASNEQLNKAIDEYVQKAQSISRDLEFKVDKELGRTVITVYDSRTEEVVRQIPAEEALQLARSFKHMSEGLLLKAKA